ncbi:hypothetical protein BS50DRAFT_85785 [Corynespora cassiicola Philippines]|uniref:Gag1-like clamp domain-containing protein n=1 Tax=Corynespora cassiicola Philippines TaxID=1448308 RepID=A0A2T2NE06_CORCC|nr:hypothetical protein BS50DRAFT_85785 [Corynespora cassiicola Philippines]
MDINQTATRSARRFLDERVRNDWDWPNTPDFWSHSDEEVRGATEFRERYYGDSSDRDRDSDNDGGATANPYKFDSPDAIGDVVESKALKRKRKRKAALEEEMEYNEGLVCFVRRRDAWTGAAAVQKYGIHHTTDEPKVQDESLSTAETLETADAEEPAAKGDPPPTVETLCPLAPTLLAGNAVRNSIGPKTYSDIYNKVVMSSRTPSVPINLSDMTKALVQGWKDSGEWPPKAAPLDPLVGRKKAFASKRAPVSVRADNHDGPFLSHHPHMKKGMESVKRILHLNGAR